MTRAVSILSTLCIAAAGCSAPASPPAPVALTNTSVARPAVTASVPEARFGEVAVGAAHSCVVSRDGKVACWGANELGQLGDGTQRTRASPVEVVGIADAVAIRAAGDATCAVHRSGKVSCWGALHGEPPKVDRGTGLSTRPIVVEGVDAVAELAVATTHACVRTTAGDVRCWGNNDYGARGESRPPPAHEHLHIGHVDLGGPAKQISVGTHSSCAIAEDGRLACWGDARDWRLPPGVELDRCRDTISGVCARRPIGVPIGYPAADVWTSDNALCVLGRSGELGCSGPSASGACKGGPCERISPGTVQLLMFGVPGLARKVGERAVADENGAVYTWGVPGDAACLTGQSCSMRRLVVEEAIAGSASIAIGDHHGCAAGRRGVTCWGANERGQLGAGDRAAHPGTVRVDIDTAPPSSDEPVPSERLASHAASGRLVGYTLVWSNAELFEDAGGTISLGKLAVWEDALRLDPFRDRYVAKIIRDQGDLVLVELLAEVYSHCSGSSAVPWMALRAHVRREALAPVVERPAVVTFEDGSELLLGAGLAPDAGENGEVTFQVFDTNVSVDPKRIPLGRAYASPGHKLPEPKPPAVLHNFQSFGHGRRGVVGPGVGLRLDGGPFRPKPSLEARFSEPRPAGGSFVTFDGPCARVKVSSDADFPLTQRRIGTLGHGAGTYVVPRARTWRVRSGSTARWPTGKVAGRMQVDRTFREGERRDGRWCMPVRGSVSLCFDERDVTVSERR